LKRKKQYWSLLAKTDRIWSHFGKGKQGRWNSGKRGNQNEKRQESRRRFCVYLFEHFQHPIH